jgi:hypothetical protein
MALSCRVFRPSVYADLVPKPKRRIYRTPTKRRNAVRWHDSTGAHVYRDGGKPRLKLAFASPFPDEPPVHCTGSTKKGNPSRTGMALRVAPVQAIERTIFGMPKGVSLWPH